MNMGTEDEENREELLREIYDEYAPTEAGMSTLRRKTPKQINTPPKAKRPTIKSEVSLGIAKMKGSIVK